MPILPARIWTHGILSRAVYVVWELQTGTELPAAGAFSVEVARSPMPDDTWTALPATTTHDFYAVDSISNLLGKEAALWYRVRYTPTDPLLEQYLSNPERAHGSLSKADYLLAKSVIRGEMLSMRKGNGTAGYLLRLRTWGTPCTECRQHTGGQVAKSDCDSCYGTGYVGGYFNPVAYWILNDTSTKKPGNDESGSTMDRTFNARMLPYPIPQAGDLWLSTGDGRLYSIDGRHQGIQWVATVRGIPLILSAQMAQLPLEHPAYRMPLIGVSTEGTARFELPPCDARAADIPVINEDMETANADPVEQPTTNHFDF